MFSIVTGLTMSYDSATKQLSITITKHDIFPMTGTTWLEGKAYDVTTVIDLSSLAAP